MFVSIDYQIRLVYILIMKKTKQKPKFNSKVFTLAIILFAIVQLGFNVHVVYWIAQSQAIDEYVNERAFVDMVMRQHQLIYKTPVTMLEKQQLALVDSRVLLPLNDFTKDVRYFGGYEGEEDAHSFALSSVIGRVSTLNNVNDVDCIVMVRASTHKDAQYDDANELAGEIKLGDKTYYIFKNSGDDCASYFEPEAADALVEAVRSAKIY